MKTRLILSLLVGATALVAYLPLVLSSSVGWRNTSGLITNDGSLDRRFTTCFSWPTWPNNPELR